MKQLLIITSIVLLSASVSEVHAQRLNVDRLPEYIVVQTESGGLTGGISLSIHFKRSKYQDQLETLEKDYLRGRAGIKTLSDLFTYMSELGFDYVNAFEARSADFSNTRSNVVFRKKVELRKQPKKE